MNWKEDDNQTAFFALMLAHKDKIILEVTGHDHLADLRAAKTDSLSQLAEVSYLNKVIFPGMTSNTYQ